jgi:hypothetical protein
VHTGAGAAAIAAGFGLGLVVLLVLWRRVPPVAAYGLAAALGMVLGAGALLVQEAPSAADWTATLALMAVLAPVHDRFLAGPPGTGR